MVVIAAKPGQRQQVPWQRIERHDALDPAQARIGDLGSIGKFDDDTNISAPAKRYDDQLTRDQRTIARAVIEQRLQRDVQCNPCDSH